MAGGVKLYKQFVDEIAKMGRIKRAWFTSFNLDVSFFEKYILLALTGTPFSDLKSAYDYEAINAVLTNDENFDDGESIEVKVFFDFRGELVTGRPKQTVVQLYKINIAELTGLNPARKFSDGVFHPKVVLLENYEKELWLMAGSANLTFGGWSSNRESFFCEKLTNTAVARQVGDFFEGITNGYREFRDHPLLYKLLNGKIGQDPIKWTFVSSFNPFTLPEHLAEFGADFPLRVWSPYYAEDLPELVKELRASISGAIELIPAKNEAQKIRITKEAFEKTAALKGLQFRQDKLPLAALESFVHAKVWLTPKILAIGSWNMTRSGMNISKTANNNVEAGIIYYLSTKEYNEILEDCATSPLKSPGHFQKEELDEEKEDLLDKYSVVVDLIIDWDKLEIRLQYPRYNVLLQEISPDDILKLPGLGKLKISQLEFPIDVRAQSKMMLNDRFFEVESRDGKLLFRGYLREIGLASRPVNSFGNLDDFLKGWVNERPEDKQEWHRLAYPVDDEYGDDFSEQTRKILMSTDQNALFTSFHAFESMVSRIRSTRELYAKDRLAELKRIGRVLPGSLAELRNHLEGLQLLFRNNKAEFRKSPVYLWFLIEKANHVFRFFNENINTPEEYIKKLKNLKFSEVLTKEQLDSIGPDKLDKWMSYVGAKLKVDS